MGKKQIILISLQNNYESYLKYLLGKNPLETSILLFPTAFLLNNANFPDKKNVVTINPSRKYLYNIWISSIVHRLVSLLIVNWNFFLMSLVNWYIYMYTNIHLLYSVYLYTLTKYWYIVYELKSSVRTHAYFIFILRDFSFILLFLKHISLIQWNILVDKARDSLKCSNNSRIFLKRPLSKIFL